MTGTMKMLGTVGSAAAIALVVGFGGVVASSLGSTTAPVTNPVTSVAPAPAQVPTRLHYATLTGYNTGIPFGNHVTV